MRFELNGPTPAGVSAKDMVLHLLALPFIRAATASARYSNSRERRRAMSIDERATLTNMAVELGGFTGIVAPDEETVRYLAERRGVDSTLAPWMRSDDDATFARHDRVDCSLTVADGRDTRRSRQRRAPRRRSRERCAIDIAYGGSCTGGKRDDFDRYHEVLAWGLEHGMRVPSRVRLYLQYGTTAVRDYCLARGYDKTFASAGARILQPSCGACANCGPGSSTAESQVTVSAINRNFPGRSGPGQVWLASPSTVMASALAGKLVSFERLRRELAANRTAAIG